MHSPYSDSIPKRRPLYRAAKKRLKNLLARSWKGSRAALDQLVRASLRGKRTRFLQKLVRVQAFAAMVTASILSAPAHSAPPIELADVALSENSGGFVVQGEAFNDALGCSVSSAGDVNGDGLADIVVGARAAEDSDDADPLSGKSYVVFGKPDGAAVDIAAVIAGTGGFAINGVDINDRTGFSVSGAGDVNGDGLGDVIVGAPYGNTGYSYHGKSFVVFGKADGAQVNLAAVAAGAGGFLIQGDPSNTQSGRSVSRAGDVNGDGRDDLLVGAPYALNNAGNAYLVFGKADTSTVLLSQIAAGYGGFAMLGEGYAYNAGVSVAAAGDVNGDGRTDIIVGAHLADSNAADAGRAYVVFGKADTAAIELEDVKYGAGGFIINGEAEGDHSGYSVGGAGDVNGDGLADMIMGAPQGNPNDNDSGRSYVVFGKADTDAIQLSGVAAGNGGFAIDGEAQDDFSGCSVAGAGDLNGDNLADVIVGARGADLNGNSSGNAYVVFGKAGADVVQLADVAAGTGGFVMHGEAAGHEAGFSVSNAGDVNGDGRPDLLVGAPAIDAGYGAAYVVFAPFTPTAVWVDFSHNGAQLGTFEFPYKTVTVAAAAVPTKGTINFKGGGPHLSTPETPTLNRSVTLKSFGGRTAIGNL